MCPNMKTLHCCPSSFEVLVNLVSCGKKLLHITLLGKPRHIRNFTQAFFKAEPGCFFNEAIVHDPLLPQLKSIHLIHAIHDLQEKFLNFMSMRSKSLNSVMSDYKHLELRIITNRFKLYIEEIHLTESGVRNFVNCNHIRLFHRLKAVTIDNAESAITHTLHLLTEESINKFCLHVHCMNYNSKNWMDIEQALSSRKDSLVFLHICSRGEVDAYTLLRVINIFPTVRYIIIEFLGQLTSFACFRWTSFCNSSLKEFRFRNLGTNASDIEDKLIGTVLINCTGIQLLDLDISLEVIRKLNARLQPEKTLAPVKTLVLRIDGQTRDSEFGETDIAATVITHLVGKLRLVSAVCIVDNYPLFVELREVFRYTTVSISSISVNERNMTSNTYIK